MTVSSTSVAVAAEASGPAPFSDGTPLPLSITTNGALSACAVSPPLDGGQGFKQSAPTLAPTGMPASMVAWMESQRASLAEILARQVAAPGSTEPAPAQPTEASSGQLTIFDLPGFSWKIARASGLAAEPALLPTWWRETCAGETESLPRLIAGPLTGASAGFALLPTLTICGNYNRSGASETSGDGLVTALRRHPPTLLKSDATCGPQAVAVRPSGSKGMTNLGGALRLLPTLCATDYKSPYSAEGYQAQRLRRSKPLRDTAAHQIGIRLCQTFCEWWMGWPIGGSALLPLGMPGFHFKRLRRSGSLQERCK